MGSRNKQFEHHLLGLEVPYNRLTLLGKFSRILYLSARRYSADQHSQRAVALTYYTLFAVVPVAALVFGIAKGFDLQERLQMLLTERFVNQKEVLEWICQFADTTLRETRGGIVAGAGVIALFWTVMWLATNIEKAFNAIWNLPARKNIFRRFSDYLAILLLTPVILVVMSSAGVLMRSLLSRTLRAFPLFDGIGMHIFSLTVECFPAVLACGIFALIYFLVPNTRVRFSSALLAGVVAGGLYQLLQDGFIYVQSALYRYNTIYGSFAALPLFLIWLQWSWQIALFGAEIGFVSQNACTGLFEHSDEEHLTSMRLRRTYQLAATRFIYRNFETGKGATTELELMQQLPLPAIMLESQLAELLEAGVLYRVERDDGQTAFAPARSSAGTTVSDIIEQLELHGDNKPDDPTRPAVAPVTRLLGELAAEIAASPLNRKIKDL